MDGGGSGGARARGGAVVIGIGAGLAGVRVPALLERRGRGGGGGFGGEEGSDLELFVHERRSAVALAARWRHVRERERVELRRSLQFTEEEKKEGVKERGRERMSWREFDGEFPGNVAGADWGIGGNSS